MLNRVRYDREREREKEGRKQKELMKGREGMMRQRNVLAFTALCFFMMQLKVKLL